jgi:hypothetical protein
MKTTSVMIILLFSALTGVQADWREEEKKVEYLFRAIKTSELKFLRNNKEYSAIEAAEHLRKKLEAAKSSWLAPKRENWTALMFIEKIASKSSLTGKSYWIIQPGGTTLSSRDWLLARLKEFEASSQ